MLNENTQVRVAMPIEVPGHLTTEQAAKLLRVTPGRIRQLIRDKILPSEKIGNSNFIPVEAVVAYGKTRVSAGWPKGKPRKPS